MVWRGATREDLLLSEFQFPERIHHNASPDQVSHNHERVAAPWMRKGGLENSKPRHDAKIAHGPDQKPVCRSRQNSAQSYALGAGAGEAGMDALLNERGRKPWDTAPVLDRKQRSLKALNTSAIN
jgi:hypothetical protein